MKDEYAIVLDFLKNGYPSQPRAYPVAQVIGETYLNILEVLPREDVILKSQQRIYVGEGKRDEIKSVTGRINSSKLTVTAETELTFAVEKIVDANEKRFVDFFTNSGPVTLKMHQLELIPTIGKKHLWQILEERKKKPFESFEDIKSRVSLLPNPKKAIIRRILEELGGDQKWYVFTIPPRERDDRRW